MNAVSVTFIDHLHRFRCSTNDQFPGPPRRVFIHDDFHCSIEKMHLRFQTVVKRFKTVFKYSKAFGIDKVVAYE